MRRLALAMAVLLFAAGIAAAEQTSGATYTSPNGQADGVANFLNNQQYIDHEHEYVKDTPKKYRTEQNIEAEFIALKYSDWAQLYVKPGFDTANGNDGVTFGARFDLPEKFPCLWIAKPEK